MKRKLLLIAIAVMTILAFYLLWHQPAVRVEKPGSPQSSPSVKMQPPAVRSYSDRATNALGDTLTDANDPEFVNRVFPKFRKFVGTLERLGVNPFHGEIDPASCSKIRII